MLESLKELSDRATPGPWGVFDTRGVVEIQFGDQKPVVHWSGFDQAATSLLRQRLNARLIVALVNAYRSGQLHDDTALAEAEARGYARGLEEAAEVAEVAWGHRASHHIRALATTPAETQKPEEDR